VPFAGVPAATRLATLLNGLFEQVLLVGGQPPPEAPGDRVPDLAELSDTPRCGLRGLVSALAAAHAERVLVLATDLPLVTPELVLGLVAWPEADAVVPRPGDLPQPLCAVYRREPVLRAARERLLAGRLALQGLLDDLAPAWVGPADLARLDPAGHALLNVNDVRDLARAEAILARSGPGGQA
jgi:molybdopterin-guanine dinucleotide biosynthesis protein A